MDQERTLASRVTTGCSFNNVQTCTLDVCDIKPDMVMICEAGTHSGKSDAFLALPGYSMIVRSDVQDTTNEWCRGLLIWKGRGQGREV